MTHASPRDRLGSLLSSLLALAGAFFLLFVALPASAEETIRDRASYAAVKEFAVDAGPVSVEARSGAAGSALLVERRDFPPDYRLLAERRGDRLELRVEAPAFQLGFGFVGRRPRVILSIPRGALVELGTSSGDISLQGHDAPRAVLRSSSGDIEAADISAELELESSSGSISAARCSASLAARSSSGEIEIEACKGSKDLLASSGDIALRGSAGDARAKTSSGSFSAFDVAGDLFVETTSGSVILEGTKGSLSAQTSSGDISGRSVRLTGDSSFGTSSGETSLELDNAASELRFDLTSSAGSLRAAGSSGERRLVAGSGRILVKGSSSSGDQSYSTR